MRKKHHNQPGERRAKGEEDSVAPLPSNVLWYGRIGLASYATQQPIGCVGISCYAMHAMLSVVVVVYVLIEKYYYYVTEAIIAITHIARTNQHAYIMHIAMKQCTHNNNKAECNKYNYITNMY